MLDEALAADAADEARHQQLATERAEEGGEETLHRRKGEEVISTCGKHTFRPFQDSTLIE